ncbi:MAG: ATP-binding protein, partial [Planctomycetaceae bacterium]|nr:ATP-binding protein [Planctomycetaceae bacterium]
MRITVAGDVIVDHHVYEGERLNPAAVDARGLRVVREHGGALALEKLIRHVLAPNSPAPNSVEFGLNLPELDSAPCGHHGLAVFKPYPRNAAEPKKRAWRAGLLMGYGHDNPTPAQVDATPAPSGCCDQFQPHPVLKDAGEILVLDDAGFVFRNQPDCWLLPANADRSPQWVVLKTCHPLCRGDLWGRLAAFRDRLVIVVSAKELRNEASGISQGLSWERTIENCVAALSSDPVLRRLPQGCLHLIVTCSADGALWLEMDADSEPGARRVRRATLVFDPGSIEGLWAEQTDGEVFGYLSCMVAAVTAALANAAASAVDLAPALSAGLAAMRNLREEGHGVFDDKHPPQGFPAQRLAEVITQGSSRFAVCAVPWAELTPSGSAAASTWSIAVQAQSAPATTSGVSSLSGLARQVVLRGRRVLMHLPHARFGGLFTVDRTEIETLRALRRLMKDYEHAAGAKPLSIGVFGPPGAGKSFGVKQIAYEIFGKEAWLEFNLSQFAQDDLIGALHQVRDKRLEGKTPVVFWDEFDSRNYEWLQYLLAPMQDGRFQEGPISHPLGRCVMIFAGATSHTYRRFGPRPPGHSQFDADAWERYKLAKGPDFISRLDGYYDVLGPNQRLADDGQPDPTDISYPMRRALLLRSFLCKDKDGKDVEGRLDIDPGLVHALLTVPRYSNGARSLEKLAASLKQDRPLGPVRRSSLCPPTQLAMFVDFPNVPAAVATFTDEQVVAEVQRRFLELCQSHEAFQQPELIEALAAAIHETYREHIQKTKAKISP